MGPGSCPVYSEPRPPVGKGAQAFCCPPGDTWSQHTAPVAQGPVWGKEAHAWCVCKGRGWTRVSRRGQSGRELTAKKQTHFLQHFTDVERITMLGLFQNSN